LGIKIRMYRALLDKHVGKSKEYQLEIKIQEKDSSDKPIYHKKLSYISIVNKVCVFKDNVNEWEYFLDPYDLLAFIKTVEGVMYDYSVIFHAPEDASPFDCKEVGECEASGEDVKSKIKSLLKDWQTYVSVEFER